MALGTVTLLDSGGTAHGFGEYAHSDGTMSMVGAIITTPPFVFASTATLTVGTAAAGTALSNIGGGIPTGATHAVISVNPAGGAANPNSGNLWVTTGTVLPNPSLGVGLFVGAGVETELTNLGSVTFRADQQGVIIYPEFRKYSN